MEISRQIELLNRGTKAQRRYANAESWLKEIINNTDNDIVKNNLIKAMRSRVVDDWHMFEHQTRAYLNQYLDLLKNNPNLEHESEKTVSELTRLRIESNKKKAAAEKLHNKIISQYEILGQIIESLPNIVNSDEVKSHSLSAEVRAFLFPDRVLSAS